MARGRLPNFLVIGSMKCGTTSLHKYLESHPQISMAPTTDVRFFSTTWNWKKGLDWYRSLFADSQDAAAVGEVSPTYTSYPYEREIPQRIAEVLPGVRLIYLVRDPLARIRSHYQHNFLTGQESLPINAALLRKPLYLYRSQYAMQLDQYRTFFPEESILVIRTEDLRDSRVATMQRVFRFLEVDADWESPVFDRKAHQTSAKEDEGFRGLVKEAIERNRVLAEFGWPTLALDLSRRWRRKRKARDIDANAAVSDDVTEFLTLQLIPDVERLHSYLGPDFNGWGIA